jgi:DNA-binding IclR family transcriptional regulator
MLMPVKAIRMARDKGDTAASEQKVEAVERALTILDAFGDGSASLSLGELAERTKLYRSTILRLAASLERFGYLNRGIDGRFRLGPTLWRLGVQYQNAFNLADYVRPVLRELVAATGETAAFYVREGERRICLYRQHAARLIGHHLEEGADLPLDRGASARILVAFTDGKGTIYDRVRDTGFYVSKGERDADTAAIAVPVFGRGRAFVGALGVTGPISRFDEKRIKTMSGVLSLAAQKLSKSIGGA